jgi:hypothetical protein
LSNDERSALPMPGAGEAGVEESARGPAAPAALALRRCAAWCSDDGSVLAFGGARTRCGRFARLAVVLLGGRAIVARPGLARAAAFARLQRHVDAPGVQTGGRLRVFLGRRALES